MSQITEFAAKTRDQLAKAKGEIVGKITKLEELLKNRELTPEEQAALKEVTDCAQALDDVVADEPAPPAS